MAQIPWNPRAADLDATQKVFGGYVCVLAAGDFTIIPAAGMANLNVAAEATATAVVRRVNNLNGAATGNAFDDLPSVPASTYTSYPVGWPFYRVEAVTAGVRVSLT